MTQLENYKVKQVCCSDYATILLLENGSVFQLGGTNMMDKTAIPSDANEASGVPGLDNVQVVSVACGDYHAAAIDSDGNLYTWGGGKTPQYNKGQCGHGTTEFYPVAKRVEGLAQKRVEQVACGSMHTLVVTDDKQLYTFGAGEFGECGAGDQKNKLVPTRVDIPKPKKKVVGRDFDPALDLARVCQVAAGKKHSVALSDAGNLFTFGYGDNGQLGHKNTDNQKKPAWVSDLEGIRVASLQAGAFHTVI